MSPSIAKCPPWGQSCPTPSLLPLRIKVTFQWPNSKSSQRSWGSASPSSEVPVLLLVTSSAGRIERSGWYNKPSFSLLLGYFSALDLDSHRVRNWWHSEVSRAQRPARFPSLPPFLSPSLLLPLTLLLSPILPTPPDTTFSSGVGRAGETPLPGNCLHARAHGFPAGPSSAWSLRRANYMSLSTRQPGTRGPKAKNGLCWALPSIGT